MLSIIFGFKGFILITVKRLLLKKEFCCDEEKKRFFMNSLLVVSLFTFWLLTLLHSIAGRTTSCCSIYGESFLFIGERQ